MGMLMTNVSSLERKEMRSEMDTQKLQEYHYCFFKILNKYSQMLIGAG